MRRLACAIAVALCICPTGPVGLAEPKPALVPASWQLEFRFEDPQRLVITLPGEKEPRVYWYMLYKVVNNSGRDVQFMPQFEIVTEDLRVIKALPSVDPAVFRAIKAIHGKTRPLLLEPLEVMGRLLQGEDNAKESVAVWPDFSGRVSRFTVYVGGLSGESVEIPNPNYRPGQPEYVVRTTADGRRVKVAVNPRKFVLYKTLAIPYTLPGDARAKVVTKPVRGRWYWVMR